MFWCCLVKMQTGSLCFESEEHTLRCMWFSWMWSPQQFLALLSKKKQNTCYRFHTCLFVSKEGLMRRFNLTPSIWITLICSKCRSHSPRPHLTQSLWAQPCLWHSSHLNKECLTEWGLDECTTMVIITNNLKRTNWNQTLNPWDPKS